MQKNKVFIKTYERTYTKYPVLSHAISSVWKREKRKTLDAMTICNAKYELNSELLVLFIENCCVIFYFGNAKRPNSFQRWVWGSYSQSNYQISRRDCEKRNAKKIKPPSEKSPPPQPSIEKGFDSGKERDVNCVSEIVCD